MVEVAAWIVRRLERRRIASPEAIKTLKSKRHFIVDLFSSINIRVGGTHCREIAWSIRFGLFPVNLPIEDWA